MGSLEGKVLIREAMKKSLSHHVVHGNLPEKMTKVIDPVLKKDEGSWSRQEHHAVLEVFDWAATHC